MSCASVACWFGDWNVRCAKLSSQSVLWRTWTIWCSNASVDITAVMFRDCELMCSCRRRGCRTRGSSWSVRGGVLLFLLCCCCFLSMGLSCINAFSILQLFHKCFGDLLDGYIQMFCFLFCFFFPNSLDCKSLFFVHSWKSDLEYLKYAVNRWFSKNYIPAPVSATKYAHVRACAPHMISVHFVSSQPLTPCRCFWFQGGRCTCVTPEQGAVKAGEGAAPALEGQLEMSARSRCRVSCLHMLLTAPVWSAMCGGEWGCWGDEPKGSVCQCAMAVCLLALKRFGLVSVQVPLFWIHRPVSVWKNSSALHSE